MPPAAPPAPPKVAPEDAEIFAFEVTLSLNKQQAGSGLKLVREEGISAVLVVSEVNAGPVAVWNSLNDDFAVQRGDRIMAVNGQSCEQMADVTDVQQEGDLTVSVQRWQECYQIKLERKSQADKLGMKLELVERVGGMRSLRVGQVGPGLMLTWNTAALADGRPHMAVSPGTQVLQVGALSDNHEDMMTALQSGDVELTLRRPELRTIERRMAQNGGTTGGMAPGA